MSGRLRSRDLHDELADIYRAFPGVSVKNSKTEDLWRKIEELERREGSVS